MTTFEHVVLVEEAKKRIDKLLVEVNSNFSRTQIQLLIKEQYVTVNDVEVKANYKCQQGDIVRWTIPEVKPKSILPENIPLSIVYEDEDILIVNKPRGMVVHPTADTQTGTLVNALLYHCNNLSRVGGMERPGIVHRIDKDTSGLLIIAKDDQVHTELTEQLSNKKIERKYEAIVHGVIEHEAGIVDAPIGRDPKHRLRMGVTDEGRAAVTHFRVLNKYKNHTYLECQLETGRTHQIRVHMKYIGHPVVGDPKYGSTKVKDINGQALFAKELGFTHPSKNEWMHFEIERPTYFLDLLAKIERMS